MFSTLSIILIAYVCAKTYISLLQINFIKKHSKEEAVVLEQSEYENAAKIAIENQKFDIFSNIFSVTISLLWLGFGLKILFANTVKTDSILENVIFVVSFLLINTIIELPLSVYEKFVKDKKQGFSNVTPKIFITDLIKSMLLMLVFGSAFIWLIIICIENLGTLWWLWAFLLSFAIILTINLIYPTIIAPIFNKVTPLEDGELKSSIQDLLLSLGFKSSGVFTLDASKRDNRLNAYFGGLGKTKRVVLFDTLIKKLNLDEIIAVLGHELGHFKHKDIIKMIVLSSIMIFALFAIFGNISDSIYQDIGMPSSGGVIVFLMIFSPIFNFFFNPIMAFISRKNEFNADKFGSKIKDKDSMISALKKLGSENKAFPKSHQLYSTLYHSHPSLYERIERLKSEN
ncbi:peptidase, M48 family [Campylobacter pinnipediorum subsp. caledonicus]|uniref:Peptidase, M48 family n=1 Tax=Campylobacter pinnipediorum subsp. caledonicus TaxID=1874362 RepID=A0A1S6U7M3_9BACT|nr:M48 family metallopeptidase [Campylobacter pinnipediorum]AQW87680.1 peptidase, M48 family [Campylobacter pinnipediorum subsp. caledonicus]